MTHTALRSLCTPSDRRLAVMQALSGSPVPALTLIGGVPLSLAVAEAVHSSLPSLKELVLDFAWRENDLPAGRGDEDEDVAQYYYGAMQLLTLCGPRLTDLRLLGGVQDWPALAFQALRQCTALTSLQMEAGRMAGPQIRRCCVHPSARCALTKRHARHLCGQTADWLGTIRDLRRPQRQQVWVTR